VSLVNPRWFFNSRSISENERDGSHIIACAKEQGASMLVLMKHDSSICMAYKSPGDTLCGICKQTIRKGSYYTRHQAPDPRRSSSHTGFPSLILYFACSHCAPYMLLEQNTGEFSLVKLAEITRTVNTPTETKLPAIRAKSSHLSRSIEQR
jgi:hypothetical protein